MFGGYIAANIILLNDCHPAIIHPLSRHLYLNTSMLCLLHFFSMLTIVITSNVQQVKHATINAGLEQDILPYVSGGYFVGV